MEATKVPQRKAQYTSEFKQEAVRLVKSGKSALSVAKLLNMPHQTLENWLRLDRTAKLVGVDHKPVTVEQIDLARLRAENARLKMERGLAFSRQSAIGGCSHILKKATAYCAREHL